MRCGRGRMWSRRGNCFGDVFRRWILDRRGSLKPASVYVLKNVQTRLRVLDRVEIGEITPALVQRLVVTMQDASVRGDDGQ
jgi:hypothetical protein